MDPFVTGILRNLSKRARKVGIDLATGFEVAVEVVVEEGEAALGAGGLVGGGGEAVAALVGGAWCGRDEDLGARAGLVGEVLALDQSTALAGDPGAVFHPGMVSHLEVE